MCDFSCKTSVTLNIHLEHKHNIIMPKIQRDNIITPKIQGDNRITPDAKSGKIPLTESILESPWGERLRVNPKQWYRYMF